jgi:hypothetical protein
VLRQANDEGGDETRHEGGVAGADDGNRVFQEKYAKAVKVFEEYKEGASFTNRVNRDILSAMCESHGLSITGYKTDLLSRLKTWVCPS